MTALPGGVSAALAGRTFLVTGGCGLVGSRVVRLLGEAGCATDVVDTMDAYDFDYVWTFGAGRYARKMIRGSVADPAVLEQLPTAYDAVIHAAAYADVAGCLYDPMTDLETNVRGTQVLLDWARSNQIGRFVFLSSASVYGSPAWEQPGEPPQFREIASTAAVSTYANSKLWGETQTNLYGQLYQLPVTCLRYFSVYGEPQVPKRLSHSWCVAWFAMRAAAGYPLRLNGGGDQVRDFIHVDDVAVATVLAAIQPEARSRTINIGTGVASTVRSVAEMVTRHFPGTITTIAPRPAGDPLGGYADTQLMTDVLDWKPTVDLAEGVDRYVRWLRSTPEVIPEWLTS